jgi:hypothetical protein
MRAIIAEMMQPTNRIATSRLWRTEQVPKIPLAYTKDQAEDRPYRHSIMDHWAMELPRRMRKL